MRPNNQYFITRIANVYVGEQKGRLKHEQNTVEQKSLLSQVIFDNPRHRQALIVALVSRARSRKVVNAAYMS